MAVRYTESEKLLEVVGRLYFIENKTQTQIAMDPRVVDLYRLTEQKARKRTDELVVNPSQTTINRLIQRAKQLGVVRISVNPVSAVELIRDSDLSRALRNAFLLKDCSVLRPIMSGSSGADAVLSSNEPQPRESSNSAGGGSTGQAEEDRDLAQREQDDDDRLILGLANFTAREFRESLLAGDHVVCGGGRTICWLARAVRRNPPSKPDIIFTPLSGRLWVEDWRTGDADIMERPLDADDAVHTFAEAFENEPGRFSQINHPLYEKDTKTARDFLNNHCALGLDGAWNWGLPNATRAFVGVGWLDSAGHRLSIFLKKFENGDRAATESYLKTAGRALQDIRDLCNTLGVPLPGDLGNRLFPCVPLPDELRGMNTSVLQSNLTKVRSAVEHLNHRGIVMSWNHLRRTRSVRAIAAGTKLPALWSVLIAGRFDALNVKKNGRGPLDGPLISELTTDERTAKPLLSALEVVLNDDVMSRWYQETLCKLGLIASSENASERLR